MTPSVLPDTVSDTDIEAEAEASEARETGTELIRDHLRSHLANNPSSSYVTWIATIHPENATVQIDPRFLIPGNPWMTVYEETKFYNGGGGDAIIHADAVIDEQQQNTRTYVGFLDLIVGMAIALAGASSTFAIEIVALLVHYMADFFEGLTSLSSHYAWSKYSFGLLWLLLEKVLRLVECILLFVSIMVIELLAVISWLLCGLLGMSSHVALAAHQRTRRLSHFTRWASRRRFCNHHHRDAQEMVPEGTIVVPTATVIVIDDDNNIQNATVLHAIDDDHEMGKG